VVGDDAETDIAGALQTGLAYAARASIAAATRIGSSRHRLQ